MQLQVLSSGSKGNACLIRVDDTFVLVDAGLPLRELRPRLDAARLPHQGVDHVVVTHAHLDHARSAGAIAKRHDACVHCAEAMMRNRSVARAPRLSTLGPGTPRRLEGKKGGALQLRAVQLPHDCDPTFALEFESAGRRAVVLTDMGRPDAQVAASLAGAHVLVLEFNYCEDMLRAGPYPEKLKRRIAGDQGHLSNRQAQEMLTHLAGPELHTLVLAHLSDSNNTPALAREAACETLVEMGLDGVRVLVAEQHAAIEAVTV